MTARPRQSRARFHKPRRLFNSESRVRAVGKDLNGNILNLDSFIAIVLHCGNVYCVNLDEVG
jgi:hypothetical protein